MIEKHDFKNPWVQKKIDKHRLIFRVLHQNQNQCWCAKYLIKLRNKTIFFGCCCVCLYFLFLHIFSFSLSRTTNYLWKQKGFKFSHSRSPSISRFSPMSLSRSFMFSILYIGERREVTKKNKTWKHIFQLCRSLSHCPSLISIYLFHMRSYALTHFHTLTEKKTTLKRPNHFNVVFPQTNSALNRECIYTTELCSHNMHRIACTNYSRSE